MKKPFNQKVGNKISIGEGINTFALLYSVFSVNLNTQIHGNMEIKMARGSSIRLWWK